jgi:putative transposase
VSDYSNSEAEEKWDTFPPGFLSKVNGLLVMLEVPVAGRNYVKEALEAPSRRVRSGTKNVSGAFPSRKMGMTIAFESRTLELSEILNCETNPDVLGFVAQLPQLKVEYWCSISRRTKSFLQTPDFLEIRENKIEVVECKPMETLKKWAKERPDFICRDEGGQWRCPPLEKACALLGLTYRLVCEADLHPVRTRNLRLLLDYMNTGTAHDRAPQMQAIKAYLTAHRQATISEIQADLKNEVISEDIYRAIAIAEAVVDLAEFPLVDHDRTVVYLDESTRVSHQISLTAVSKASQWLISSSTDLKAGGALDWDGRRWRILNIGSTQVTLLGGDQLQDLDRNLFDRLIRSKSITSDQSKLGETSSSDHASHLLLQRASPTDIDRALKAHKSILPFLTGLEKQAATRTQRRYLALWRAAEAGKGNGFVGLLPHFARSGNRTQRIGVEVMKIVKEQTDQHYLTCKKSNKLPVYQRIVAACAQTGYTPPSYTWYCSYVKRMPAYSTKLAREGRRAAYGIEPRQLPDGSHVGAGADIAFQRSHLDHTELEVETSCSQTSALLGRPWLSALVDDFSRDILAYYLSWDPPSYRSVLMVLRDCVRRHGRLPDEIVCDGGKDMASIWFESVAAFYGVTITRRPAARPRFGSRGERMFLTIDYSLLHNLSGNTQLRKNVRQLTPEVDPDNHAIWTIGALGDAFEAFFEHYRNLPHRELLLCPREVRERSTLLGSNRVERRIAYDRNFMISTCPTTKIGRAKVQADGVKINYLYYNAPKLQRAFNKKVPVRFEPLDMSVAYALVDGEWLELSSRFALQLRGRTERELQIARDEYFRGRQKVERTRLTEKTFITFLEYLDRTEQMLRTHHQANEMRRAQGDFITMPSDEGSPDSRFRATPEKDEQSSPGDSSPFSVGNLDVEICEVE